ncbi:tautomerase family protein [Ramlibacter sp. MMS24-I3-19]|uniref:tautomerase family protein n=1 Tax=Ramlibacter sp. MMS24-I3-19 TaxID=3416606 RepID=UPI003D01717B
MPSAVVEIRRSYSPEQETYLLESVHDAIVRAFKVAPAHRNVTLIVHQPHRFLGRPDCPPEWLTNVSIYLLPGRSVEAKRKLYRFITEAFSVVGIPPECVLIRVLELPAENFGVRGGQALCDVELGYPVRV